MTLDVTSCYRKSSLFVPTRYQHVHQSNMLRFGASKDDKSTTENIPQTHGHLVLNG